MPYRIKVLLSKNNGDWRRRSAIIIKPNSTLTFNQFTTQCAQKLYPHHTITNSTPIKLYDITNLSPIDDDDKNTPLSDLFEDNEIYRNCQILVILPLIHKKGIINPSNQQKIQLKEEQELLSYLSNTNTNTSISSQSQSHSLYPSSIGYQSSIHSTNKSFHTLSSIRKFNSNTQSHTPLILAKNNNNMSDKNTTISPFELPEIPCNNTIANIEKSPLIIASNINKNVNVNVNNDMLLENVNVNNDMVMDDDMNELICTLKNEDENIKDNKLENTNGNKRTRKDFKPSINNKRHKKKKKKKHNISDDKQKQKNNGKKRKINGNVNGVSKPMGIMENNNDDVPRKKRKLNNKQRDKTNDKLEMDATDEEDIVKDIDVKDNDNDEDNSEEESEYEEIVEYMMIEIKVGNSDGFDLHQYDKCILQNMFDCNRLQNIKLKRKNKNIEDEFQGRYGETLGSHLFFKQNNIGNNNNNNANENVDDNNISLEYVDKSDIKCVFSQFKPKLYPS